MYKKRFRDWGWRKYLSSALALEAAKKRTQLEVDGHMPFTILVNGKPVSSDKIDRHVKRRKVQGTASRREGTLGVIK